MIRYNLSSQRTVIHSTYFFLYHIHIENGCGYIPMQMKWLFDLLFLHHEIYENKDKKKEKNYISYKN